MSTEKTLAEKLAESRATGEVFSSTKKLFPEPRLPAWEELRIKGYARTLCVALALYFVSLFFVWRYFTVEVSFPFDTKFLFLAISINYIVLVWSACLIQLRLQQAGVQKSGWGMALIWSVLLNPVILGWVVPVFVLWRVSDTHRRLTASVARPTAT